MKTLASRLLCAAGLAAACSATPAQESAGTFVMRSLTPRAALRAAGQEDLDF